LLQLRGREQKPTVDLSSLLDVCGNQPFVGVFLCQVEHNCNRLGEHEVVVNEHWDSAGRIDLEELRATVFAGHEVDGYRLEVYA
jgi:hypothetical protein